MALTSILSVEEQAQSILNEIAQHSEEALLLALQTLFGEPDRRHLLEAVVDFAADKMFFPSRILMDNRYSGTVKSFNAKAGYGFVECPEIKQAFGNDVFVHWAQMGSITQGSQVSFAVFVNKDAKPQAFDMLEAGTMPSYGKSKGKSGQQASKGAEKGSWGADKGKGAWGAKGADFGQTPAWEPPAAFGKKSPLMMDMNQLIEMGANATAGGGTWKPSFTPGAGKGAAKGGKERGDAPPTSEEIPGLTDERFVGTVKSFSWSNGYGFIISEEVSSKFEENVQVFVHQGQIGSFGVGDEVSFEVFLNKNRKPQAKKLESASSYKRQRLD